MRWTEFGRDAVIALLLVACGSCSGPNYKRHVCKTLNALNSNVAYKRDYQYARFQIFDVGRSGADVLVEPGDHIIRMDLYKQVSPSDPVEAMDGVAYQDVRDRSIRDPIVPITGRYAKYTGDGFEWVLVRDDRNRAFPYLRFYSTYPRRDLTVLAYYLVVERDGDTVKIGDTAGDSLRLQILKMGRPNPTDPFWDAEWKNVYDLGERNLDYDQLMLDIYKGVPGDEANPANPNEQNGVPYLQILGLDRANVDGQPFPDGRLDNNPVIIDLETGLLVFPDRQPFDTDRGYAAEYPDSTLNERVPAIYETDNYTELQQKTKYYFRRGLRTVSDVQFVGHLNLVPESDEVFYNGRHLIRGSDYRIDYAAGQITLLNEGFLDPTGDLEICYDYYTPSL